MQRRVTLLVNPAAGNGRNARASVDDCADVFRSAGLEASIIETASPEDTTTHARAAVDRQHAAVFACGGDGTMHLALQGLAGQTQTALGVIPLGSANVLARHLVLPLDPVAAARAQRGLNSQVIPAGRIAFTQRDGALAERFFLTVAGAGPDGMLVYRMLTQSKQKLGRLSYYFHAATLFARQRFAAFDVDTGDAHLRAVSAMTIRVRDLGGIFSPLGSGDLGDLTLNLTIVKPPAHLGLPAWFGLSWARMARWNRLAETRQVPSFRCTPHHHEAIQVQADGEHLGRAPMQVTLVPNALRLITPQPAP